MSGRHEKEMKINQFIEKQLMGMPPIMTDYYYSLISSGKTYTTAKIYIYHIEQFMKFLYKNNCPNDFYINVKSTHINKYIASLQIAVSEKDGIKISDSYKTLSWSALKSFFDFLVPEYININPVAYTKRPKMRDNPEVTFLNEKEMSDIFENVKRKSLDKFTNRDLCILKVGFATGLRVSAISQLNVEDIDFKNNRIKVIEKGHKECYVLIGEKLKAQIREWLEDRKKYFDCSNNNALFLSQENTRISVRTIERLIKKYTDVVDKKVTPHVMRHSCATNLYEKTGDIYLCAKQLNHKNVSTTQRYAELSKEKQKQAANILDNLI